jgi:hypothetical protein
VSFLVERFGFGATVEMLRYNRDGSRERFQELLTQLVGMDEYAWDRALGEWLLAPGRVLLRDSLAAPAGYVPPWSDSKGQRRYESQEYAVTRLPSSGDNVVAILLAPLGEFEIEVQVRIVPPARGAVLHFEIMLPGQGGSYLYKVAPSEQTFSLEPRFAPEWATAIDWTRAPAIHAGTAMNRLALRGTQSELVLRANDMDLARIAVEPHGAWVDYGGLVVSLGHREDRWAEARFSELLVTNAQ